MLGDLRTHSFRELWHSDAYNDFRRQLLTARSSIEMCRNCSEASAALGLTAQRLRSA